MYQPNYQLTHKIVMDLLKFETEKTIVQQKELTPEVQNKIALSLKGINMFHLAHMIGVDLTLKDAEKAAEGKRISTEDARGTILNNFRNVLEYTRSNVPTNYVDLDLNVILHLNKILLSEWRELWDVKFRSTGEDHDYVLDNWFTLKDVKVSPSQIQEEVLGLIDWFKSTQDKIPVLLRTGVFIYRMVRLAPFSVLNKITILAVADYLLYKTSYLQRSMLSLSRNFDLYDTEYIEAITYASENEENITLWLERFIHNITNDLFNSKPELDNFMKDVEKSSKQPFLDLNKRQLKILRYLQTIPTVKREDYVQMMDVSTMTAFRDLDDLVHKKLIKVEGKGRATRYMLSNR